MRALRCEVLKVPNPTNVIGCPFFNDLVMPSKKDSTAALPFVCVMPVTGAIFAMRSCLFMTALPVTKIRDAPTEQDEARRADLQCVRVIRERSGSVKKFRAVLCSRSCGLFGDSRQRGVEDRVGVRGRRAELGDVGIFDFNVRLQTLALDRFA